jgi:hypothetical protein
MAGGRALAPAGHVTGKTAGERISAIANLASEFFDLSLDYWKSRSTLSKRRAYFAILIDSDQLSRRAASGHRSPNLVCRPSGIWIGRVTVLRPSTILTGVVPFNGRGIRVTLHVCRKI